VVQFHGEITTHAGLRAVVTAGVLQVRTVVSLSLPPPGNNDNAEFWKFRPKNPGEVDDDTAIIFPNDYNVNTNNNVWCRIG
jgi:hypothetical protein